MPEWIDSLLLGYGPLGAWLAWQLIRDRAQSKTISELTEALSENANSQQTIAQAITDIRTYLMGQGR